MLAVALWLAWRFVHVFERIAGALEAIADDRTDAD
jgi:hypothetical protein